MRTTTSYICDLCGHPYSTADEAVACENAHVSPAGIMKAESWPSPGPVSTDSKYPYIVWVKMADGKTIKYAKAQ